MKTTAIIQSSYIPWQGYFDLIHSVDVFVLYDHVQFTKRDWRSRNRIKTANGPLWLTIPIKVKGRYNQSILEAEVSETNWAEKHWNTIKHNYQKSPNFSVYADQIEALYIQCKKEKSLSKINYIFIKKICQLLSINTPIICSQPLAPGLDKTEQLIHQCKKTGASKYFSGPAASCYLDLEKFKASNIEANFFNYPIYPSYSQLHGEFLSNLSIIDLLMNEGENAKKFFKEKYEKR